MSGRVQRGSGGVVVRKREGVSVAHVVRSGGLVLARGEGWRGGWRGACCVHLAAGSFCCVPRLGRNGQDEDGYSKKK